MKRSSFLILFLSVLLLYLSSAAIAGWSPAIRLTWTPGGSFDPAIAIDSSDVIHVVWNEYIDGGDDEIYYRRSSDGGAAWTSPKRLTWTSGASSSPAIAIDSKKGLHVIWYDDTPGNQEIYYRRSLDGGATWGTAKRLTWTPTHSYYTAIAVDSNDAIHISWTDNASGSFQIYYRRSTDRGSSWVEIQRLTWTAGSSYGAAVDVDSGGAVHLVWSDNTPGNYDIDCKKSADGGTTWSGVQRLTWNSGDSRVPSMAADSSHIVHLVWMDLTPGNYEVYYKKGT